ncbi:MAG: protein translocase subunit SecF [Acutalibacteraceae bacterium]|nr:protein translocase subunit SecF [Acutalibacteraceae bacterium]
MSKFKIDFNKSLIKVLIVYAAIFVAGIIVTCIFGVNLDINFRGGTRISYSYTGDIADSDIEASLEDIIDGSFKVDKSTSLAGDTKTFSVSLIGSKSLSAEVQENMLSALQEDFKDNEVDIYDSNSVSPTIAGTFFAKSLVAVLITAVLVIIYVGIRFSKIGGVSAALTALCALVFDVLISFFICVFFRLQIDSNYIAVVLTILGYSLNDTIVIYDRVRENRKLYPDMEISELVNMSISKVSIRNVVTSVTTFLAIITIVVVSEIYGLTSLRTFAIPMAFGVVSGAVSSLFIAGPLWVIWKNYKAKKAPKKAK